MSEIKRYFPSDMQLNLGQPRVVFTEHSAGQLCVYEDVAPIIQEFQEELTLLREKEPAQEIPSWMVDGDICVNLCDVCGNPVRYGSRHHMCGQDSKKEK